jgi:hypothetical protein
MMTMERSRAIWTCSDRYIISITLKGGPSACGA